MRALVGFLLNVRGAHDSDLDLCLGPDPDLDARCIHSKRERLSLR